MSYKLTKETIEKAEKQSYLAGAPEEQEIQRKTYFRQGVEFSESFYVTQIEERDKVIDLALIAIASVLNTINEDYFYYEELNAARQSIKDLKQKDK